MSLSPILHTGRARPTDEEDKSMSLRATLERRGRQLNSAYNPLHLSSLDRPAEKVTKVKNNNVLSMVEKSQRWRCAALLYM